MFTWLFKENYLKEKSYQPFNDNQKENLNTLFLLFLQFKRKTHCWTWTRLPLHKEWRRTPCKGYVASSLYRDNPSQGAKQVFTKQPSRWWQSQNLRKPLTAQGTKTHLRHSSITQNQTNFQKLKLKTYHPKCLGFNEIPRNSPLSKKKKIKTW